MVKYIIFSNVKERCVFLGGHETKRGNKKILEFNFDTESWTEVGTTKWTRTNHAVSVVSFDDYEKWCN